MTTKFSPRVVAEAKKPTPAPSLAYKPFSIGAVIKNLLEEKNKTKEQLAAFMKVRTRTVEKWFTRPYLSIPRLMKISEFLEENLMAMYHPNVKDPENPLTTVVLDLKKKIQN